MQERSQPLENRRNYYRILHIQPDAPEAIVRASYRTQMQKLRMHPDLGGDEWNAAVLNEAYQVLSDPVRRRRYDQARATPAQPQRAGPGGRHARNPESRHASRPPGAGTCPFCGTARPLPATDCGPLDCPGCQGPVERPGHARQPRSGNRRLERVRRQASMVLYTQPGCRGLQARLCDLSPTGLQLQLPRPLVAGLLVRIHSAPVSAIGRVRYCNRSMNGMHFLIGIEFLTVRFGARTGIFLSTCA